MKRKLTREESQHLIDLGIPKEKASAFEYIGELEWDICDDYLDNPINEKAPIFITDDLLEILPKEIKYKEKVYRIDIFWNKLAKRWSAWYLEDKSGPLRIDNDICNCGVSVRGEFIDTLYELVCWCSENKFIKDE